MEHLHRLSGRLDVARDLIDRAMLAAVEAGFDEGVLDKLSEATRALGAAAASVEVVLRPLTGQGSKR